MELVVDGTALLSGDGRPFPLGVASRVFVAGGRVATWRRAGRHSVSNMLERAMLLPSTDCSIASRVSLLFFVLCASIGENRLILCLADRCF